METAIAKKLEKFFTGYKQQLFKKGEILIRAGDEPSGIFYIEEGIVRQYYISKKGEEITLNMFKPHSFFPMSWAISDMHNNYYFEAMTNTMVHKASKEDVFAFIHQEPDVLMDLLRRVYIGIEGLWMHIEYLAAGSALEKLTAVLIILAKRLGSKEETGTMIQIKMTEKELSEYAGIYRETVSREFSVLKQKGVVLYDRGIITIPNMQDLEALLSL